MSKIEVDKVSFAYPADKKASKKKGRGVQGPLVLKEINLQVEAGEFVCILGQSGCGKSTLLRLLAGLEQPTGGEVRIDGENVKGATLNRGVVFQDYGLFPWMTAGENIMLALKQKYPGEKKEVLKQKAVSALKDVGLGEEVYRKLPKELSGGMQQRCSIAQAFGINPPTLLMDEPFGALDAVTRAKLQDLLLDLWSSEEERKTVFFVTHDVDEALYLANRIVVLGQSPSHVIADIRTERKERIDRSEQFEDLEYLKLRNRLIEIINEDISGLIERNERRN